MDRQPRRVPEVLELVLDALPPASGAVVMGTGIVSVALLLDGQEVLSTILLVIAAAVWLALAWLLPARAITAPERFEEDLGHPTSLTSIAGTGVLGTRLTLLGWDRFGAVLLVLALGIWIMLVPLVLRNWRTPTIGASFIVTVATESLALLATALADADRDAWLLYVALVPFALGLGFYVWVLRRFQFRQLLEGVGDHWVTGGALAISTVTAGRIVLAARHTGAFGGDPAALKTLALVLWCLTMAWLPALLVCEALAPRLRYSVRRWSTVFPVGMYAACSFVVGAVTDTPGITDFARVWVWVALAVWALVFGSMLRGAPELVRESG
ncbi:MAG: tellurite resistance/C4-dicarboxylate transporter family protein [Solirubrobacteraceae bacterium]